MTVDSDRKSGKRPTGYGGGAGSLVLEKLTKQFQGYNGGVPVTAVDQVNLTIEPGQMITLLGPSGCGKTTTLRMISGFEQPSSGKILLEGRDITNWPANKRDMAMVFQSYALFPHLSVFENVAYGLKVKKLSGSEIKERVKQTLELTELSGFENRQPNQLSGGQQQRVALARAIVVEPKVLLFDEPLSNLDAKLREQMRVELRRIQQRLGLTGVYVTHDQAEAMTISDLVVVMNSGRIEQAGNPVEIYQRPVTRFVAEFIGKASFMTARIKAQAGENLTVEGMGQIWQVAQAGRKFNTDQAVQLVIRPEGVNLGKPAQLQLEGTVVRATYLGSHMEYEIALEAGPALFASIAVLGQSWLPGDGERVSVGLVESALAVLPA